MKRLLVSLSLGTMLLSGTAFAIELFPTTGDPYRTFGDFQVYSLALLNLIHTGTDSPGPYTIPSSGSHIDNQIVIYTGANGQNVTTNPNPDNAYPAPSGNQSGATYFSTSLPAPPDPGGAGQFPGDTANSWDYTLANIKQAIGSNNLLFYFNNNDSNSPRTAAQDIYAWGRVALVDTASTGAKPTLYFDLIDSAINSNQIFGDVTAYTSPNSPVAQPDSLTFDASGNLTNNNDYVRIHGQIEVCTMGGTEVPCNTQGATHHIINQNLGRNNAAFALFSPEIQAILDSPYFGGYDVMQLDVRLANLSGGGEQLFIKTFGANPNTVPEPGTMVLLGSGMAALAFFAKRRRG